MSRVALILTGKETRERACHWVRTAPMNTRFELKECRRSIPQNARLWASLTDIARQVDWHGVRLSPDDWKLVFMDALKQEMRLVPNLNGTGFINLGRSSSDLSKSEMSDLLELMYAFGANYGVKFHDKPFEASRDAGAARQVNSHPADRPLLLTDRSEATAQGNSGTPSK